MGPCVMSKKVKYPPRPKTTMVMKAVIIEEWVSLAQFLILGFSNEE